MPDKEWIEAAGLVVRARLEVHCHLCLERDGIETVLEVDLEHPDPTNTDEAQTWYRVPCPACTKAYGGVETYIPVQIVAASQLPEEEQGEEIADDQPEELVS